MQVRQQLKVAEQDREVKFKIWRKKTLQKETSPMSIGEARKYLIKFLPTSSTGCLPGSESVMLHGSDAYPLPGQLTQLVGKEGTVQGEVELGDGEPPLFRVKIGDAIVEVPRASLIPASTVLPETPHASDDNFELREESYGIELLKPSNANFTLRLLELANRAYLPPGVSLQADAGSDSVSVSVSVGDSGPVPNKLSVDNGRFRVIGEAVSSGSTKDIFVAFRGTSNLSEFFTDVDFGSQALDERLGGTGDARVHAGFQEAYFTLRDEVLQFCKQQVESSKPGEAVIFNVIGHSLGGALATLAAIDLSSGQHDLQDVCRPVKCVTFGCPRVGNQHFANAYATAVSDTARFTNKFDAVPRLPFTPADETDDAGGYLYWVVGTVLKWPQQKIGGQTDYQHVVQATVLDFGPSATFQAFASLSSLAGQFAALVTKHPKLSSVQGSLKALQSSEVITALAPGSDEDYKQALIPHFLVFYEANLRKAYQPWYVQIVSDKSVHQCSKAACQSACQATKAAWKHFVSQAGKSCTEAGVKDLASGAALTTLSAAGAAEAFEKATVVAPAVVETAASSIVAPVALGATIIGTAGTWYGLYKVSNQIAGVDQRMVDGFQRLSHTIESLSKTLADKIVERLCAQMNLKEAQSSIRSLQALGDAIQSDVRALEAEGNLSPESFSSFKDSRLDMWAKSKVLLKFFDEALPLEGVESESVFGMPGMLAQLLDAAAGAFQFLLSLELLFRSDRRSVMSRAKDMATEVLPRLVAYGKKCLYFPTAYKGLPSASVLIDTIVGTAASQEHMQIDACACLALQPASIEARLRASLKSETEIVLPSHQAGIERIMSQRDLTILDCALRIASPHSAHPRTGFVPTEVELRIAASHARSLDPARINLSSWSATDYELLAIAKAEGPNYFLTDVYLENTEVTDFGITELAKHCNSITKVDLGRTGVADWGVTELARHCSSITTINLGSTKVRDSGIMELASQCSSITSIDLTFTWVTDSGVYELARHCTSITTINLSWTEVTDSGITDLARHCSSIRNIDLSRTRVSNSGVTELARHCSSITTINLNSIKVTDSGVTELAKHCSSITNIDLQLTGVSDDGVAELGRHCRSITNISLSKTSGGVTDSGVTELAKHCSTITHIDLTETGVTDSGISELATHCSSINTIILGSTKVTDFGITELARLCSSITHIGLIGTEVTDSGVTDFAKHCSSIVTIQLRSTKVTDSGFNDLKRHCSLILNSDSSDTGVAQSVKAAFRGGA